MPERTLQALRNSRLFAELDKSSLTKIAQTASIRSCEKGDMIFQEGDPAEAFFIVSSGKVKVFKLSADGKEQILMIAEEGESFAEAAMFSGSRYPAGAQTLEESEILTLSRDKFLGLVQRNPNLALNMMARLSDLLRQFTRLVEGLSLTDVTTRLAHFLVGQVGSRSFVPGELVALTLTDKKTTLASQLGTIPETLSRSLAKLARDDIIRVNGAEIEILDLEKLKTLAK